MRETNQRKEIERKRKKVRERERERDNERKERERERERERAPERDCNGDLQVFQRVERLKAFVIKICQGIIVEISAA